MRRAERVLHKGQQAPDEGKEPGGKYTSMLKSSTPKRIPLTVTEMVQTERTPARLRKRKVLVSVLVIISCSMFVLHISPFRRMHREWILCMGY